MKSKDRQKRKIKDKACDKNKQTTKLDIKDGSLKLKYVNIYIKYW